MPPSTVAMVADALATTKLLRAASSRAPSPIADAYQSSVSPWIGNLRLVPALNEKRNRMPIGRYRSASMAT